MYYSTRTVILSAFVLGGLALGCTGPVSAADTELLKPNTNWAASEIKSDKTESGNKYCALARRFENNSVLTFARNGEDESSVAIDFQKQTLNPLRNYKVSLNPGYSQNRDYDIKPVSGGALVVRLGQDFAFFDALGRSSRLDIKIDDEEYKFSLTDFLGGQRDLNDCLTKLPVTKTATAEGKTVSSDELVSMQASESNVRIPASELEALKQENMRLRNVIERERRDYEDRYMSEGMDSSAVSELSEKIRLLEIENGQLHVQLSRLKEGMSTGESCSVAENDNSSGRLSVLQQENDRLKTNLREQAERLTLLENNTGKETKGIKGEVDTLKKLRITEEELLGLKNENKRLQGELDAIRNADEDERINISSNNWNLEKATRRFNEAEREIRRLGSLLEDERSKCTREKREIEYMLFDPEIADKEQTAKLLELETELDKAKAEIVRQKDTYKDRIKYLEEELAIQKSAPSRNGHAVASVNSQPLAPVAPVHRNVAPPSPAPVVPATGEREELLRRISQLQQENTKLQAQSYRPMEPPQVLQNDNIAERQEIEQSNMSVSKPALDNKPMARPEMNQFPYLNEKDIEGILTQAGISTNDGVIRIDIGSKDTIAHSWSTGHMFGSAEQMEMNNAGRYDSFVVRYLGKTEGRCPGEFASVPSAEKQIGTIRASSYEIACVGQENSASAAILFFSKDGMFTAIAHETTVDGMDIAMDTRDRLFDVLTKGFVVSNNN